MNLPPSISGRNPPEASRQPIKLKRVSVACKRCRRLRCKCVHQNAVPPCEGCRTAGGDVASECFFPRRGEDSSDREYRHKRNTSPSDSAIAKSATTTRNKRNENTIGSPLSMSKFIEGTKTLEELLPPDNELIEGCRVFVTSYFQLGFIPKATFLERLSTDKESISVFLLLAILSVSARFTPCLVQRYGDGVKASDIFLQRANALVPQEMYKPSLEAIQAFFILSTAQWGHADGDRSFMNLGIAVRMAGLLRLHREETYLLSPTATAEDIIKSEVARRTFWMVENLASLQSGINTPSAFSLPDISVLLPCEESDFSFGLSPVNRAALVGTDPEISHPHLASIPTRSLFATLIQIHNLWGQVARKACQWENDLPDKINSETDELSQTTSLPPWDSYSEYARLCGALLKWESELPPKHRWSLQNLRGYRTESLDLAFLSIVMVLRLSNIIIRRVYLPFIAVSVGVANINVKDDGQNGAWKCLPNNYWQEMADDLFTNVLGLYEQLDAYFPLRPQGFPPIIVFCVYICGSLSSYLCKWPQLCPKLAPHALTMFNRALSVLTDLQHAWPKAKSWQNALATSAMILSRQQTPQSNTNMHQEDYVNNTNNVINGRGQLGPSSMLYELALVATHHQQSLGAPVFASANSITIDSESSVYDALINAHAPTMEEFFANSFEAELTNFLRGDIEEISRDVYSL